MKLTESQLRILVKEEIDQMVDEGLFSFLSGVSKPAVDAAKAAGSNIKKFAKKSWRSGKLSSLAGDMETASRILMKLYARGNKMLEELPDEAKPQVKKWIGGIKSGATQLSSSAGKMKAAMEE